MSAFMYDLNGKQVQVQSVGPGDQVSYKMAADVIPIIRPNQTVGVSHIPTGTVLRGPNENVMMVHQQAVDIQMAKEKRLQSFQKKTKMAARTYIESMKSEEQVKIENNKKIQMEKKQKMKEFENKVKGMRKSMKVKPPTPATQGKRRLGQNVAKPNIKVTNQGKF